MNEEYDVTGGFDGAVLLALLGAFGLFAAIALLFVMSYVTPWPRRKRADFLRTETLYKSAASSEKIFPCLLNRDISVRPLYTPATLYLSVVVPAMNEEERLPIMLDECLDYLENRFATTKDFSYEVIVVDDGSTDSTADVAAKYSERGVKVLRLEKNRGKGGAVRAGVLRSSGKLILFADADGATKFQDIDKVERELIRSMGGAPVDESFPGISIGSRSHLEEASKAERSFFRTVLMIGFHILVRIFAVQSVRDTQCGFKMFTRGAAARLFPVLHIERWAFDVELLYLCEKWKLSIREVGVQWSEIPGSKITPFWSWIQMGRDLVLIWFRYAVGIWRPESPSE